MANKIAKQTNNNTVITFELERETKNTVRYMEKNDPALIGTLYIQKLALKQIGDGQYPQSIQVAISAVA